MQIKLCKNYVKKKKLAKKLALVVPDADVKVKSCIGMCHFCKAQPTAIVHGKKIKKKSIKKFLKILKDR
jgi:uncharacterized protein YuzB (UPF0349 family)